MIAAAVGCYAIGWVIVPNTSNNFDPGVIAATEWHGAAALLNVVALVWVWLVWRWKRDGRWPTHLKIAVLVHALCSLACMLVKIG